jgi:hypothetical protein
MQRARRNQRDLFDETQQVMELRPDLRNKLVLLLQLLLAEAAGVQRRRTETADHDGAEAGDDQDHA